jgi:hypothetical protein
MVSGTYTAKAVKSGYYDESKTFTVAGDAMVNILLSEVSTTTNGKGGGGGGGGGYIPPKNITTNVSKNATIVKIVPVAPIEREIVPEVSVAPVEEEKTSSGSVVVDAAENVVAMVKNDVGKTFLVAILMILCASLMLQLWAVKKVKEADFL